MGKTNSDQRDVYYRKAKETGYRARSAYKLLHCDEKYKLFDGVDTVVDLCSAPGSWSQVCAVKLEEFITKDRKEMAQNQENMFVFPNGTQCDTTGKIVPVRHRVVSVDLQDMSPIPGVYIIKGDITEEDTIKTIINALGGHKAGLVVCDGAPDVTGFHNFDEFMQGQLLYAAFSTALNVLRPGGSFVSKIFKARHINLILAQMKLFFSFVDCYKPPSSRPDSCEHFLVCKDFKPVEGFTPCLKNPILSKNYEGTLATYTPIQKKYVPLLACGDLSGWDKKEAIDKGLMNALGLNDDAFEKIFMS
uniref:Putative tRNA (cytidine(32)/guanosine(34)-2'-O)-methyltransferase n=1 Tax=Panagrolaimus sp. ES5 TaxID=591445 RepID=A0AC34GU88_9BILA